VLPGPLGEGPDGDLLGPVDGEGPGAAGEGPGPLGVLVGPAGEGPGPLGVLVGPAGDLPGLLGPEPGPTGVPELPAASAKLYTACLNLGCV